MIWICLVGFLVLVGLYDLLQNKHAVLRNFPVIGHLRYWLEALGPELRQYIVANNNEERPFSRDQRRWIYASSKEMNNYFGFGSDNEMESAPSYLIVKQRAFPKEPLRPGDSDYDETCTVPCRKVLGKKRARTKAFRPRSVINISGMSFGSLSGSAIEALNRGALIAGCLHNTGEGGVSSHHLKGGDLIWQIGTGYFGCRELDGRFDIQRLEETVHQNPQIKAIEIKLSQGAKPGVGGFLPGRKINREIASIRGIPVGLDCASPASHSEFSDADTLLDFVELIATQTGLPVGIKSAVGESEFWATLARLIATTDRAPDFVTIDGGEGGTGAGPLVFSDHVALPFKVAFNRVHQIFSDAGIVEDIVFIGSGKLGFPESALLGFSLGCDLINVGREAMLAIGCIQAQRCHTNHCPAGITTQNRWLAAGLNPSLKSARLANYIFSLRKDLLALAHTCGVDHPTDVMPDQLEMLDDRFGALTVAEIFSSRRSSKQNVAN
tara:strand:- start:922 stop:2406 length:1485 start_codon:yes stop_codon:yes gene_type:complete